MYFVIKILKQWHFPRTRKYVEGISLFLKKRWFLGYCHYKSELGYSDKIRSHQKICAAYFINYTRRCEKIHVISLYFPWDISDSITWAN